MKLIFIPYVRALALVLMLAAPHFVAGQEYIKSIPLLDGSNSIVRDIDGTKALIASNNKDTLLFMLFDEDNQTATAMTFKFEYGQTNVINDFEIYKDTVYFIGTEECYIEEDSMYIYRGLLGYFPLDGFPYTPVSLSCILNGRMKLSDVAHWLTTPH